MQAHNIGDRWCARAPSNIAWIKYMGKKEGDGNQPCNPSLSYTLPSYYTEVRIRVLPHGKDHMVSEHPHFTLNAQEQARFLSHVAWLKRKLQWSAPLEICSANNFAKGCGLASSASSFAALTTAVVGASRRPIPYDQLMAWSQRGSGSSCRSFFAPWALWDHHGVTPLPELHLALDHHVVLLSDQPKEVSSSEAHRRVVQSSGFDGRILRANARLNALLLAMKQKDWPKMAQLVWDEFFDMHELFHQQGFTYQTPQTVQALSLISSHWACHQDGPIVTMDAGANIHLFTRKGTSYPELMAALKTIGKVI